MPKYIMRSHYGEDDDEGALAPPSPVRLKGEKETSDDRKPPPKTNKDDDAKDQAREAALAARAARVENMANQENVSRDDVVKRQAREAREASETSAVARMPRPGPDRGLDEKADAMAAHLAKESLQVAPGAVPVYPMELSPVPEENEEFDESKHGAEKKDSGVASRPSLGEDLMEAVAVNAELAMDKEDIEAQVDQRVRQETDDIAAEVQRRILGLAVQADVLEQGKEPPPDPSCNKKRWLAIAIVVGIVAIVVVVLAILLIGDDTPAPTSAPTTTVPPTTIAPTTVPPTPPPTEPPRVVAFRDKLENEFGPIEDGTPQHETLYWLALTDPAELSVGVPFRTLKERYVIALLHFATNGENWVEQFGFLDGNSTCEWNDGTDDPSYFSGDGIFCDDSVSVTHIKLQSNGLQGNFPAELTALQSLKILALISNRIQGTIPTSVGSLSSLEVFELAQNFIEGSLPETLFDLPQLETVYLFENRELTGTLPNTLGTTGGRKLVNLGLGTCRLSGTIPASMADLSSLEFLNLAENPFQGLIPAFTSPSITDIFLWDNNLEGEIPASIGALRGLRRIAVAENQLGGPIPLFTGSTSLTDIWLQENSLTGNLEQFLTPLVSLRRLESLHVGKNSLVGPIPSLIGNFTSLTSLSLNANDFGGPLPSEFGRLTSLQEVDLDGANLDGSIPSELGSMTALTFLDLQENNFGGTTVPTQIGNLRDLTFLSVALNRHVGIFPTEIASIPTLERLWVNGNNFAGDLEPVCSARSANPIGDFYADCAGPVIETECSCCTHCCDSDGLACEEMV